MSFSIDGYEWDVPCKIVRETEMTSSEVSGMLLDKSYYNDVIGTYLKYTVTVAVPFGREEEYTHLYNTLTDPIDAHQMVLPYNQDMITITARVGVVSDEYVRMKDRSYWRNTTFTATSVNPVKTYTLGEAITRGLAPLPEEGGVERGQTYMYTDNGWELIEYGDADQVEY